MSINGQLQTGYRSESEAAHLHSIDRQRTRLGCLISVVGALIAVILLVLLGVIRVNLSLSQQPQQPVPPGALFVNSGLARSTLTRTIIVTFTPQPSASTTTQSPDVVAAVLEQDAEDRQSHAQFPASQVQLSASPIGPNRIQLSTTVNPQTSGDAGGGTYRATIDVLDGTQVIKVPFVLFLASRDGALAGVAIVLLIVGAAVGLGVKWITESLSRLAAARWRLRDLDRRLGNDRRLLPVMANVALDEIEDKIRRQDTDDLDRAFRPLLQGVLSLRVFSAAARRAEGEIDQQRKMAAGWRTMVFKAEESWTVDREFVESIIRAEDDRVEQVRALEWPWEDGQAALAAVQNIAVWCSVATRALGDLKRHPTDKTAWVLELLHQEDFPKAATVYNDRDLGPHPLRQPEIIDKEVPRVDSMTMRPSGFRALAGSRGGGIIVPWMAQRPRWFAGLASIVVVALVGLQLQYLNSASFDGELGDWLALMLWAAVIELSGVSVLDVLGKLGVSVGAVGGPARPSTGAEATAASTQAATVPGAPGITGTRTPDTAPPDG